MHRQARLMRWEKYRLKVCELKVSEIEQDKTESDIGKVREEVS